MKTSGVEAAVVEMDYEEVENMAGVTMPVSKPAAFKVEPEADFDPEGLEQQLEKKGLGKFDEYDRHNEETGRWYYKFEIIGEDYKRISVKMWPDALRIYPRENQPDVLEMAQITSAIERGMDCELHHDPIDDD